MYWQKLVVHQFWSHKWIFGLLFCCSTLNTCLGFKLYDFLILSGFWNWNSIIMRVLQIMWHQKFFCFKTFLFIFGKIFKRQVNLQSSNDKLPKNPCWSKGIILRLTFTYKKQINIRFIFKFNILIKFYFVTFYNF